MSIVYTPLFTSSLITVPSRMFRMCGLIENTVMLLRGVIRTIRRTKRRLTNFAGRFLSTCQKGRDGTTPVESLRGKKPSQEFVPFSEKVLARQTSTDLMNRMNLR